VLDLNCCFIFEDVVSSYNAPPMRLTHCFHFVTYNKRKSFDIIPALQLVLVFVLLQALISVSLCNSVCYAGNMVPWHVVSTPNFSKVRPFDCNFL